MLVYPFLRDPLDESAGDAQMNKTRNIFFDLCADEPALTIAPCISIPITDVIRTEDAAKLAARTVRITWKFTPSEKSHKPSHTPRHPHNPDRRRPCKKCSGKVVTRMSTSGLCRQCKAIEGAPTFDPRIHHGACKRGHAFTPENTLMQKEGVRRCRECNRDRKREWAQKPEAIQAAKERKVQHGEA